MEPGQIHIIQPSNVASLSSRLNQVSPREAFSFQRLSSRMILYLLYTLIIACLAPSYCMR